MCLYRFVLHFLLFFFSDGRALALTFEWKIEYADFTDWMSFLPASLVEEVTSNPETLSSKPIIINKDKQERIAKSSRDENNLCMNDKKNVIKIKDNLQHLLLTKRLIYQITR